MKLKLADDVSRQKHPMRTMFWRRLYSPHHATHATAGAELSTYGREQATLSLLLISDPPYGDVNYSDGRLREKSHFFD